MKKLTYVIATAAAVLCLDAAYAQNQPPKSAPPTPTPTPDTANPSSASSPHQREVTGQTGTQEAPPSNGAEPADASSPHQREATDTTRSSEDQSRTRTAEATMDHRMRGVTAGTGVRSPSGEAIGTVKDIVPDNRTGRPAYVVIGTASGRTTAVPYSKVIPMVHNGEIVLDRARLDAAPSVSDQELQSQSSAGWHRQVDQYWRGTGQDSSR